MITAIRIISLIIIVTAIPAALGFIGMIVFQLYADWLANKSSD